VPFRHCRKCSQVEVAHLLHLRSLGLVVPASLLTMILRHCRSRGGKSLFTSVAEANLSAIAAAAANTSVTAATETSAPPLPPLKQMYPPK
jgi:hypothetical protein